MDPNGRAGEFVKRLVRDCLRDPMTDEEQEADYLGEYNPMEKNISTYKAQYISMGYDNDLAESTAAALAKGDVATVFANGKKHQEAHDKSVKASMLGSTKLPPAGDGGAPLTVEDIMKIKDTATRQQKMAENPELFGLG